MGDLWTELAKIRESSKDLKTLFSENPTRFAEYSAVFDDLLLDYSKTHLEAESFSLLLELAASSKVAEKRDAIFAGEKINSTENRAVLHTALRNIANTPVVTDGADVMPEINRTPRRPERLRRRWKTVHRCHQYRHRRLRSRSGHGHAGAGILP